MEHSSPLTSKNARDQRDPNSKEWFADRAEEAEAAQSMVMRHDGDIDQIALELDFANDNAPTRTNPRGETWTPPQQTPQQRIATRAHHELSKAHQAMGIDSDPSEEQRRAARDHAAKSLAAKATELLK
jgi:hypothetical protein